MIAMVLHQSLWQWHSCLHQSAILALCFHLFWFPLKIASLIAQWLSVLFLFNGWVIWNDNKLETYSGKKSCRLMEAFSTIIVSRNTSLPVPTFCGLILIPQNSSVASPKNLRGGKTFDFRRITLLFGKTPLKARNDYIFLKLGGHGPFGYAYATKFYSFKLNWWQTSEICRTLIKR